MNEVTKLDIAVKGCIIGLVVGVVLGVAFGMDYGAKTAPKNKYTIYQNGTLEVYEWIAISTNLPEEMDQVYTVENDQYMIFLWTEDSPWDKPANLRLRLKVLRK